MKNLLIIFVILLFNSLNIFAQKTITIGILVDQYSENTEPLVSKLKQDIIAVSGSEANIIFKGILQNNFDLDEANSNYQDLVESNTDIILSFGTVNSLMLIQKDKFSKPTIVFGALSTDLLEFNDTQKTSGINNLTFIISPFSYKEDLNVFKELYDFKKIGVLIEEHLFSTTYLTKIFDDYFSKIDASFTFIPINAEKMTNSFDDVDAVYLIGGFHLSNVERLKLINEINSRKLPSFTSLGVNLVEEGILATNKPKSNIEMFSRRIALSIEAIITGENAANLPLFIDYKSILTINYNVANLINFPLRYSLVAKADFVGSKNKRPTANALSVVDVMNEVLNKNLGLASEKKNIEISEQNIRNAKSSYVPQLNASIRGSYFDPKSALLSQGQNAEITTVGNLTLNQTIYSETNQANIFNQKELKKDITAAYIAPKGFSEPIRSAKSGIKRINLSSGAYFYDGSIRMGVSNVIKRSNGQNDYDVKYLAEEQPDVAREFVKTLTAKAGMKIGNKSEESIKAEAELLTSLTNNIQKLATESATLNLSRSILYRLNESLYNNVSKEQIELFQMVANKLIELQEKEFEAKLMSEKSKILADLNSAISELQELGFEKNKIIGLIDKAVGATK